MTEEERPLAQVLRRLESIEARVIAHEGKCAQTDGRRAAYWKTQHEWNRSHDEEDRRFRDQSRADSLAVHARVTAIERRVMYLAGAAAAGGGILGSAAAAMFGGG